MKCVVCYERPVGQRKSYPWTNTWCGVCLDELDESNSSGGDGVADWAAKRAREYEKRRTKRKVKK